MQRLLLALCLTTACSESHEKCGMKECGGGETCDLTDPSGPTCISADGDADGDGITNADDFCPHLAGGKYDEDGDGLGDECDRCPIAPPNATPDPDIDNVDAPCDPDDHEPGDTIIAFSGFHELPATWMPKDPAAWVIQDGALVVTPPDATTEETLTIPITRASNHISIQARWRVDSLTSGATENTVALGAVDRRPAGTASMQCGAVRDIAGDHLRLDTNSATGIKNVMNLFKASGTYRMAAVIDAATAACAIIGPTDNNAVDAAVSPDAMSEANIIVKGTNVRFDYILITARNPGGTM